MTEHRTIHRTASFIAAVALLLFVSTGIASPPNSGEQVPNGNSESYADVDGVRQSEHARDSDEEGRGGRG